MEHQYLLLTPMLALCLASCSNDKSLQNNNNMMVHTTEKALSQATPKTQNTPIQPTQNHQKAISPKNNIPMFKNGFAKEDYPISIREISEDEFHRVNNYNASHFKIQTPHENLDGVKKELKGIVDFNNDGTIKRINFNNGGVIENTEGDFVSYYDNYDDKGILVLEGGHTSDITYNLNTGKSTEHVGNPNQASHASPKKQYRLTGYFGGQECSTYFIQKHINGEWVKIIELNDIFNKLIPPNKPSDYGLCSYDGSLFLNENTAYILKSIPNNHERKYVQVHEIKLKNQHLFKQLDLANIPKQSLPLEVMIDFDNYEKLTPLNKEQAKFFAGLYPNAKEIYILGKVQYQPNIDSLIMTYLNTENEHEIMTELINIDKQGNIIDAIKISYDEVAESWSRSTAILTKDHIKVMDFFDGQKTQEVIYQIDNKGYFYTPKP